MTRFGPGHRKPRTELGEVVESHSSHHHHHHHTYHRHQLTGLLHQDSRIFTGKETHSGSTFQMEM